MLLWRAMTSGARTACTVRLGAVLVAIACAGCAAPIGSPGAGIDVARDVVYLRRGERALTADVYAPRRGRELPAVLLVHGGSWQRGDKERMAEIGERLAGHGYVAVSIDYRLAPEHRFPAQLHDCQAAIRWMRANAERLRLDPSRIAGFGYSAGAHLVALLATADEGDGLGEVLALPGPDTRLQAAVLGAPPIALERFPDNRAFRRFLGATAAERPDVYAMASPLTFVTPDDPPMFLYHGASDWMVDPAQSRLMLDALQRASVPASYFETPRGHFTTFLFDDGQVDRAIEFLDRWL